MLKKGLLHLCLITSLSSSASNNIPKLQDTARSILQFTEIAIGTSGCLGSLFLLTRAIFYKADVTQNKENNRILREGMFVGAVALGVYSIGFILMGRNGHPTFKRDR